jgi:hypothetical protein
VRSICPLRFDVDVSADAEAAFLEPTAGHAQQRDELTIGRVRGAEAPRDRHRWACGVASAVLQRAPERDGIGYAATVLRRDGGGLQRVGSADAKAPGEVKTAERRRDGLRSEQPHTPSVIT